MLLTGVSKMSEDDNNAWEEVTGTYISTYYMKEGGNVRDVVGYVCIINTMEMGSEDIIMMYFQQASWQTDNKTFDPRTLTYIPFQSEESIATYIKALNKAKIPATGLVVLVPLETYGMDTPSNMGMDVPEANGTDVPDTNAMDVSDTNTTDAPAESKTAPMPAPGPMAEEGPTIAPITSLTAVEGGPTISPATSPMAENAPTSAPTTSLTPGVPASPPIAKTPTVGAGPALAGGHVTSLWYGMLALLVGILILY